MGVSTAFKPGEEVFHKSGGSMMIVVAVEGKRSLL
jgi:uncharacterized protein YodC (DUF2158 family)